MWNGRRPRPPARRDPAPPVPAALAMLDTEFSEREFALSSGEMLPPQPAPPPPELQAGFEIEPWPLAERLAAAAPAPPPDTPSELAAMQDFDPPPLELEPPLVLEPVPRFQVPEVDWQEELRERALREQQEQARQRRLEQLAKLIDEEGT